MQRVPVALDQADEQQKPVPQAGETVQPQRGFDQPGGDLDILGLVPQQSLRPVMDAAPFRRQAAAFRLDVGLALARPAP